MPSRRLFVILVLALASALVLCAQTSTATLQGIVRDATSAVVPDAKITATNVDTGVVRTVPTNHEGAFVVPFLLPGNYEIVVQKVGFKKFTQSNITLEVQQTLVLTVSLEVGDVSTSVEVVAAPPPLETANATVATSVQPQAVTDLPLNSRLTLSLVALVPGVYTGTSAASSDTKSATIYSPAVGGGRQAMSEILVDGAPQSVIDPTGGARVIGGLPPSPDAVQEFTVQTNWMAPEYGRSGGGIINVATKQGTNSLHGTVREFYRNSKMDANDFFSNKYGVPLSSFQRHQYGLSAGGPVYLPKVYKGRNRTFFFVDLERLSDRTPATSTQTMPLDEWKTGNFFGLQNYADNPITIYDPLTTAPNGNGGYTRTPFGGNIIPQNRISPVALNITKYWPEANQASQNQFTPLNNWYKTGKSTDSDSNLTVRLDHDFTNSWRAYWRLNKAGESPMYPLFLGTGADDVWVTKRARYNGVWDNTFILNPTTTLNVRYGLTRWDQTETNLTNGFDSTKLGFPAYLHAQSAGEPAYFPGIGISGVAGIGGGGGILWRSNTHDITGSMTKVLGKHVIKAGADFRKYFLNFYQSYWGGPNGTFSFDQGWTQQNPFAYDPTAGFGFASFMLGAASGGDLWNTPQQALASGYWAVYVEDQYRITNKLTLNFGLRYDVDVPRTERYNRMSFFNTNLPSPLAGQVPQYPDLMGTMQFMSANHRQQFPPVYNQFAPRIGFAYQINHKTVVRGGYAMMYDASPMQAANHNAGFAGFRLENDMITTNNGGLTPLNYLDNPFPNGFLSVSRSPLVDTGYAVSESWFPDNHSPNIQQLNFTIQRQLPGTVVLEVGYMGSMGHHLEDGDTMNYNQLDPKYMAKGNQLYQEVPNPFYGVITDPKSTLSAPTITYAQTLAPYPQLTGLDLMWRPIGNSNFNAMIVRVDKRLSSGLNFLAAFTWAKLISDCESSGYFSSSWGSAVQNTYDRAAERAVSTDDVPARLVLSADYRLPIGHGKKLLSNANRAVDAVLGGWQLNAIWTLQSGLPIPISQPTNQTGIFSGTQRPNSNGQSASCTSGSENDRITNWFDSSVFSISAPFTFGNAPRTITSCRNPGIANLDASVFKSFAILRENRLTAQFRLEAFNAFNHTQFGPANGTIGWSGTGSITSVAVSPRQVQLALKLLF